MQNILPPYKFVSHWLSMHVMTGSLEINAYPKPTLHSILQTKFQYILTLKCIVYWLRTLLLTWSLYYKNWNTWSLKMPTLPALFANDKYYGRKSSMFGTKLNKRHEWIMNKVH